MDGYSNLASSSPPTTTAANVHGARSSARPSLELTNTKETKAWEGLAIGAVTLARTFSTGSHRFCRSGSERSTRRSRSRSGLLPGALRRAFSMRRFHPAGSGGAGDGYWRIHDMDGDDDSDRGDDTVEERGEEEEEAAGEGDVAMERKKAEQRGDDATNVAAAEKEGGDAEGRTTTTKKKRGGILKACKKLFRL
ncbi:hypothetical protein HU200_002712 [Digitaria exilis]|uniref:Uncharacterized protein n=1 Tax=Digitaria exilis TaxID=1010633 RepID=A0A835KVC7_9POAL|nr:hypothetical protein HU200_002712 [Digitaria exilis]